MSVRVFADMLSQPARAVTIFCCAAHIPHQVIRIRVVQRSHYYPWSPGDQPQGGPGRHQNTGVCQDQPKDAGPGDPGRGLCPDRVCSHHEVPRQGEGGGGPLVPAGLQGPGTVHCTHVLYTVHKTGFLVLGQGGRVHGVAAPQHQV